MARLVTLFGNETTSNIVRKPGLSVSVSGSLTVSAILSVTHSFRNTAFSYFGGSYQTLGPFYPRDNYATTNDLTFPDGSKSGIGGSVAFSTDAQVFEVLSYGGGFPSQFNVFVDGALMTGATVSLPADGSIRNVTIDLSAAGLTPGMHKIELVYNGGGSFGGLNLPSGSNLAAVADPGPRIVFLGDSFTEGTGASHWSLGYAKLAGRYLGSMDSWASGFGGTGYERTLNNRPNLESRIQSDGVGADGDIYVIAMGINDPDSQTLYDSVFRTINALVSAKPAAKIFIVGPWNPFAPSSDGNLPKESSIKLAAAQFPNVVFLDPSSIPFSKADTTHPDQAGHERLAQWIVAQIRYATGADGVVEQNELGSIAGPLHISDWDPARSYTFSVLENGQPSGRFEVVYNGTSFPILKLKSDHSIGTVGPVSITVRVADGTGSTTDHVIDLRVREHLEGSSANDTLVGTTNAVSLSGGAGNDTLLGTSGVDRLDGGEGNDWLAGGTGDDELIGGTGDDSYAVDSYADVVAERAGEGADTIYTSLAQFVLPDNVESLVMTAGAVVGSGNELDNWINGNDAANTIYGQSGNDRLYGFGGDDTIQGGAGDDIINGGAGADTMLGGQGNDLYRVSDIGDVVTEYSGQGNDAIISDLADYTLPTQVESLNLGALSAIIGRGNSGHDFIGGNANNNQLFGGAGNDALDGRDGNDTLFGGTGDDTLLGSAGDDILWGEENNDTLFGGTGSDSLNGGAGNDRLDGQAGFDTMTGGTGNDTYFVDVSADVVVEAADEGLDVVYSAAATWIASDNVETIFLAAGAAAITGSEQANWIYGNDSANLISGGGGNDYIHGGGGADTINGGTGDEMINGGTGADLMSGGLGNDTFRVDNTLDVVSEEFGEGIDHVFSDLATYTLTDNVEALTLTGSGSINGYGNALDNNIKGNALANTLSGGDGKDFLSGGAGDDRLVGGAGSDWCVGDAGANDVAVFSGVSTSYSVATFNGFVTVLDNDQLADGNDDRDYIVGIEKLEFKGGVQVGVTSPIVLDLDGGGVTTLNAAQSHARFDMDRDGRRDDTSWIGGGEGFLFLDRDGDGTLSGVHEMSFVDDVPGAASDLVGLRSFDSDGNGKLGAGDAQFAAFKVWRDANGDGRVDGGEVLSLTEAGVAAINLGASAVNASTAFGDVAVVHRGSYDRTDGTTAEFIDAVMTYNPNTRGRFGGRPMLQGEGGAVQLRNDQDLAAVPGLDIDRAVAVLSAPVQTGGIAALMQMSDADLFGSGQTGLSRAQEFITQNRSPELVPYNPADTALGGVEAGRIDSAVQLALLRQDMAGFGAGSAFDRLSGVGRNVDFDSSPF